MSNKSHSPNCLCGGCTSYDPHIMKLRSQFGKNADFSNTLNGGTAANYRGGFNDFDSVDYKDEPWLGGGNTPPGSSQQTANLKQFLGDALGSFVGNVIQAKKEGQQLPKALDIVAGLGIKTEQAALQAGRSKAESEIGKNVLKFAPYIIGGIAAVVLLYMFIKK